MHLLKIVNYFLQISRKMKLGRKRLELGKTMLIVQIFRDVKLKILIFKDFF